MKTPEEILKRGKGNFINCTDYDDAMQALADVRAEAENKAQRFAEWLGIYYTRSRNGLWFKKTAFPDCLTPSDYLTTAELFNSPEFLKWMEVK